MFFLCFLCKRLRDYVAPLFFVLLNFVVLLVFIDFWLIFSIYLRHDLISDNYIDAGTGGFDICLINQNNSTDYYIVRNNADSAVVFGRINGIFDVCITKPGYIPYSTTCGVIDLQNITISGTKTYEAGKYLQTGMDIGRS